MTLASEPTGKIPNYPSRPFIFLRNTNHLKNNILPSYYLVYMKPQRAQRNAQSPQKTEVIP